MDLRTQTSLIASVLSVAIGASVVLRSNRRRVDWLFAAFGLTIGLWYLTAFLAAVTHDVDTWGRVNLSFAVLLPVSGVLFFRAFVAADNRRANWLARLSFGIGVGLFLVILTPLYARLWVAASIFVFVVITLGASLVMLYRRGRTARSRFDRARLRYLTLVGALAAVFTILDYLPYVGLRDIPPFGTVLTLVFLYVLAQSIVRSRLLDLYELAGRLGVLTALAFSLATIFWALVLVANGRFFLHSVVAALVVLLVFDPVRGKVEEMIAQVFFRERHAFETTVGDIRRRLAHVLEAADVSRVMLAGLEASRRTTHASLYLLDEDAHHYELAGFTGPEPSRRVEVAPARPLLDRLQRDDAVVLEAVEREMEDRREAGDQREVATLKEVAASLESMNASVCVAIRGEHEIYGLVCVRDERLRDAFAPEEVQLLRGMGAQAATAIENSRLYSKLKERDRLAALGEMAAGLAHEIRNPLGAIKASAQYLESSDAETDSREFLDIIVEEVNRLNRVVSSFLDYARPSKGDPAPCDVNATVRRTMQLLGQECDAHEIRWQLALADDVPAVRVDVEQLRQVLINLVQNALQAMERGRGSLVVETAPRERDDPSGTPKRFVEIRVTDTGPGIPQKVLANLFVPFVTTKERGTGLGLAISQRIVSAAGGVIEVRTHAGVGTTFVVRLPAAEDGTGPLRTLPPKAEPAPATPAAIVPAARDSQPAEEPAAPAPRPVSERAG